MFGALNKINSAVGAVNSVTSTLDDATRLAENLGILNNEGAYALNASPTVLELLGNDETASRKVYFRVVTQSENSGDTGTSLKSSEINGEEISKGAEVDTENKKRTKTESMILLPYPQQIQISDSFNWSNEQLGSLGNVSNAVGTDTSTLDALQNTGQEMLTKAVKAAAGNTLTNQYEFSKREITNPHLASMFKGGELRSINLSFVLTPRNKSEVDTIISTIDTMKFYAHPEGVAVNGGTIPNKLKYPATFELRLISGDYTLVSMDDCVVNNISTDYTPESIYATFYDGFPVSVKLDISLTETKIKTRETYDSLRKN